MILVEGGREDSARGRVTRQGGRWVGVGSRPHTLPMISVGEKFFVFVLFILEVLYHSSRSVLRAVLLCV